MAVCELHYFSPTLGMQTGVRVLLPERDFTGPLSVLYLLHGLSDDHTIWTRRTSLERYLEGMPLMVVMPDGGRGFYCDAKEGFAYESALIADLIPYIDKIFHTRAERAGRCIGGLSMGGYGAIKLALRHHDLFVSAHSHSGALAFGHGLRGGDSEFQRILGKDEPSFGPNDLYRLASEIDPKKLPALSFDCGRDDYFIKEQRAYHAHLKKLRLSHEYKEHPGTHSWDYWDEHIQEALRFHLRHLSPTQAVSRPSMRRRNPKKK